MFCRVVLTVWKIIFDLLGLTSDRSNLRVTVNQSFSYSKVLCAKRKRLLYVISCLINCCLINQLDFMDSDFFPA